MSPDNVQTDWRGTYLQCRPHALPFRAIFQEYRLRRRSDLVALITKHLRPTELNEESLFKSLDDAVLRSETAYVNLESAKQRLQDTEGLEKICWQQDIPLKKILHDLKGTALCLSGGGIRSASYCLGTLEGLARYSEGLNQQCSVRIDSHEKPLLQGLDYLSTVSGGGYIGSWLTAWIYRKASDDCQHPRPCEETYHQAVRGLAGRQPSTSADPGPRPIRHLRDYTSFLAPKLGLSLDTWALIAIVLRNLLVNWLMIIPWLLTLVALPQTLSYFMTDTAGAFSLRSETLLWLAAALFFFGSLTAVIRMPSRQERKPLPKQNREPYIVFSFFVLPLFLASLALAEVRLGQPPPYQFNWRHFNVLFAIGICCFGLVAIFLFVSYRRHLKTILVPKPKSIALLLWRAFEFASVALLVAVVTALVLLGVAIFPGNSILNLPTGKSAFVLFSIPVILAVLLASSSLFSGLVGLFEDEIDREWWGRAGGLLIFLIVGWLTAFALTSYGPMWVGTWSKHLGVLLTGTAAGGMGLAAGASGITSAGTRAVKSSQIGTTGKFLSKYHLLVPALCTIGLLVIGIEMTELERYLALVSADSYLVHYLQTATAPWFGCLLSTSFLGHTSILLAAFIGALLSNWFININIFSLHGMYRMRLMRAFLGASNFRRRPDDFVNFDPTDTPLEAVLPACQGVPLHIINSTLNLVGTQELAWQQRKAESFTFSPVLCGGWRIGYVPTSMYAGREGPSLATAMAISGAAFNPNMGYHSSPLVTLLMTMFNVRLGWWLPNPARANTKEEHGRAVLTDKGKRFLRKNGPTIALEPLIKEALGRTDSTSDWIELTDGAHFENLALYEMVLRRCRQIIVVDVGADPDYQFEDLGNALRKIQIDLGIPIRFAALNMRKQPSSANLYCAVAKIEYKCADIFPDSPPPEDGELVYIKASLTGEEPPDIRQYAATHPSFPHETTANQFFTESQFESYRHLGSYVIDQIVQRGIHNGQLQDQPLSLGVNMHSFYRTATAYSDS